MKKIINLFALVLVAVSVIACSNPSDSIGYYPTEVQSTLQGTNNDGQETPTTNDGNQNDGENQNEQEQQNENQNDGQETPTSTIVELVKTNTLCFSLENCNADIPNGQYYINITYEGIVYKIEYFKFNSDSKKLMSSTGYNWGSTENSDCFNFKFGNNNLFYATMHSTKPSKNFEIVCYINDVSSIKLDLSNRTLIINSGN